MTDSHLVIQNGSIEEVGVSKSNLIYDPTPTHIIYIGKDEL